MSGSMDRKTRKEANAGGIQAGYHCEYPELHPAEDVWERVETVSLGVVPSGGLRTAPMDGDFPVLLIRLMNGQSLVYVARESAQEQGHGCLH